MPSTTSSKSPKRPKVPTKGSFGSDSSSATSASQQVATDTARNVRGTGNRYLETGSVDLQGAQVNSGIQGSHVTINGLDNTGLATVLGAFTQSQNNNASLGSYAGGSAGSGATAGSASDLTGLTDQTVSDALGSAGNAGTGAASSSGWQKYLTWQNGLIAAGVVAVLLMLPKLLKKL